MADDVARLGIVVDSSQVQRAQRDLGQFSDAAKRAEQSAGNLGGSMDKAAAGTRELAAAMRIAAGAAVLGITISAYRQLMQTMEQYTEIAKRARDVGVGTTTAQAFERQFERMGEKVEDARKALQAFRDAARDGFDSAAFETKASDLRQKLDQLFLDRFGARGQGRDDFINAQTNEERIRAVQRAIQELFAEGQRLAAFDLAQTAFGQSGRRIAEEIEKGKFAVDQLASTGLRDGSIISPEIIARAAELTKRLEEAGREASTGIAPVLRDIAAMGVELYGVGVKLAEGLAEAAKAAGAAYAAVKRLVDLGPSAVRAAQSATLDAQITAIETRLARDVGRTPQQQAGDRQQLEALRGQRNAIQGQQQLADDAIPAITTEFGVPARPGAPIPVPRPGNIDSPSRGGGGSGEDPESSYERAVRQLREQSALQQTILQTIGLDTAQREAMLAKQRTLNIAARDGVELTDEQKRAIDEASRAYGEMQAAIERAKEAQRELKQLQDFAKQTFSGLFTDFASGLQQGKSVWESFAQAGVNALNRIASKLMEMAAQQLWNAAFGGSGGNLFGGGFLSSIFGGAGGGGSTMTAILAKGGVFANDNLVPFAKGGAFTNSIVTQPTVFPFAKGVGLMGEAGPEAIMPLRRTPDGRLGVAGMGGGGGGMRGGNVTVNNYSRSNVRAEQDQNGNVTLTMEDMADRVEARMADRIGSRRSPVGSAMAASLGTPQTGGLIG